MSNGSSFGVEDAAYLSNNAECPKNLPCPSALDNTQNLDELTKNVYDLFRSDDFAFNKA